MIVRLTLAYDGTGFRGWARQRDQRTVQGALEAALERFLGEVPKISVAGRTDAGVHARGQVVSFGVDRATDLERMQQALNAMLGPEVAVLDARPAPEGFDARFSATAREYRYRIDTGPWADPFTARFVWHRPGELTAVPMRLAARHVIGEHDFTSFCRRPPPGASAVRTVERLTVSRSGDRVELVVRANAFLHQMVRSLVGTLVMVGEGRIGPDHVGPILAARDRTEAGPVAPPRGLTLDRVIYGRRTVRAIRVGWIPRERG